MKARKIIRTYTELKRLPTFEERYEYLRLAGIVGENTFGFDRYLNQKLYRSRQWKKVRDEVILRDNGCDLGIEDRTIMDRIIVHHMNPLLLDEIDERDEDIFNPEFLICVSPATHNAIHFGDDSLLTKSKPVERTPNDTCTWKR
jgi:hypothetical protein